MTTLERVIEARALTLNAINLIVGASIFAVPAIVGGELGAAGWVAVLLCGVLISLVMLCFAAAGSRVTGAGGLYAYTDRAFGPFAGSVVGVLLWLPNGAFATSAVCALFVSTLAGIWPALDAGLPRALVIIAIYLVFTVINVRGVRPGVRVSEGLTAIKLTPLLLLVAVGVFFVRPENLRWESAPPLTTIAQMTVLLTFTFMGGEGAINASGEVRDPSRSVPRALLLSVLSVTVLYMGIQVVAQGVLGASLPKSDATPLADTAGLIAGSWARQALIATALVSILGYFAADTLSTPRTIHAQAQDGLLPAYLARVHPRYRTPHVAIIAYTSLSAALALTGTFRPLAIFAAAGSLTMYLIACAAALVLQRRDVRADREPIRLPGGPTIPLVTCGLIIAVLSTLTAPQLLATLGTVATASFPYWIRRFRAARTAIAADAP